MTVRTKKTHIDQRIQACRTVYWVIRARVRMMPTCSDAKPATLCTESAVSGFQTDS